MRSKTIFASCAVVILSQIPFFSAPFAQQKAGDDDMNVSFGNSEIISSDGDNEDGLLVNPDNTNPSWPKAYLNSSLPYHNPIVPPAGPVETAELTWKNPYFQPAFDYSGKITCLHVTVDNGPPGIVDCENTGNNNYKTSAPWITSGHTITFYLATYEVVPKTSFRPPTYAIATVTIDTH